MQPYTHLRNLLLALLLCSALPAIAASSDCERPNTLRWVIKVPETQQAGIGMPTLASYIQRSLRAHLGGQITVKLDNLSDPEVIYSRIKQQQYDLAMLDPRHYVDVKKRQPELQPFAAFALAGSSNNGNDNGYQSLLIVRSDSHLEKLAQLQGKKLALIDPSSSAGYLIPHHIFPVPQGLSLEKFFGNILESGDHTRSIMAVADGAVDAAFVASTLYNGLLKNRTLDAAAFTILWRSENLPTPPFILRPKLCDELQQAIKEAILQLHTDPETIAAFESIGLLGAIVATDSDYDILRRIEAYHR